MAGTAAASPVEVAPPDAAEAEVLPAALPAALPATLPPTDAATLVPTLTLMLAVTLTAATVRDVAPAGPVRSALRAAGPGLLTLRKSSTFREGGTATAAVDSSAANRGRSGAGGRGGEGGAAGGDG